MNRRDFLRFAARYLAAATAASQLPATALAKKSRHHTDTDTTGTDSGIGSSLHKPKFEQIVLDDEGYGDNASEGGSTPTPHMDSIAKHGVKFADGYVSCPVCSPTRAGLITGRYQQRFGHEFNPGPDADDQFGLPLTETTIATRMKKLGYATGAIGKWHLGYTAEKHPLQRGFDEFYGFLGGAHDYFRIGVPKSHNVMQRGTQALTEMDYATDEFGREAVAFIHRHKQQPFFLYMPFNAAHSPLEAPQKYLDRFKDITDKRKQTYAAMLSAMDDAIGSILQALKDDKLENNTMVFCLSDNGGPTLSTTADNGELSGYKATVLEGGIRVPFMVKWPGVIPAGKTIEEPVISLDIASTMLAAAGAPAEAGKNMDGRNLLPLLKGKSKSPFHEYLFWRFGEQHAVRKGSWKLVKLPKKPAQLFNLDHDIGEKHDAAAEHPQILNDLQKAYDEWNAQLMEPLWHRKDYSAKARRLLSAEGKTSGSLGKKGKRAKRLQNENDQTSAPADRKARKRKKRNRANSNSV
jgi:arylsulfatase A-like enzyme